MVVISEARKIRVALVGLVFGDLFIHSFLHHPNVESLTICDINEDLLNRCGDKWNIERRVKDIQKIIDSDKYDAVLLFTPIPSHADQSIAVLESGKHCACAVPMATSIEGLEAVVDACHSSKRNYMMLETNCYHRNFFYCKELIECGELGRIQFLRGEYYQDMENWPSYWRGLPPMHYATHALSPLLALAKTRAVVVHCFGSGVMREELHKQYGNPYPVETAIFQLESKKLAAQVTRSLSLSAFAVAVKETFNVYGDKMSFEWNQLEDDWQGLEFVYDEKPLIFKMLPIRPGRRGRPISATRITVPDRQDLLPKEIARFTRRGVYDEVRRPFLVGGAHGGAHPHLVHEFVRSIIERRKPWINEITAANWTAAGICAHESAMKDGKAVEIPHF